MKVLLTLLIIWVIWKVLSAIKSGRFQMPDLPSKDAPEDTDWIPRSPTVLSKPGSAPGREPEVQGISLSGPGEEEDDLERWYREAMERKRRMEKAGGATRSRPAMWQKPMEPARSRTAQPTTGGWRLESPYRPHRVEPERRHVARPREVVVSETVVYKEPPPEAPRRARRREMRPRTAEERRHRAGIAEIFRDKNEIRKGIIIAEILGPPKGLRDIDSHTI